jgi:hypothetical protein
VEEVAGEPQRLRELPLRLAAVESIPEHGMVHRSEVHAYLVRSAGTRQEREKRERNPLECEVLQGCVVGLRVFHELRPINPRRVARRSRLLSYRCINCSASEGHISKDESLVPLLYCTPLEQEF